MAEYQIVIALLVILVTVQLIRTRIRKITVFEFERGLFYIVASEPIASLLESRAQIRDRLMELAGKKVQVLGVELIQADVKDLTLPGELKKLFTQVTKARQEGLAALERARGETAALRNLANAARLVSDTPALLQLRLLQVVGEQPSNTVVVGFPAGATPLREQRRPADATVKLYRISVRPPIFSHATHVRLPGWHRTPRGLIDLAHSERPATSDGRASGGAVAVWARAQHGRRPRLPLARARVSLRVLREHTARRGDHNRSHHRHPPDVRTLDTVPGSPDV